MVSAARKDARKEKEPLERRNEQLQVQLNDAHILLASHQEQLAELKMAMQDMTVHRIDLEASTNVSTAPSTPAMDNQDHMNKILDALNLSPATLRNDEIAPAPPMTFTNLLQPVLRLDLQAYEDFHVLLETARKSQPSSRVPSGNYAGLNGLGLGNLTNREQSQILDRMPSNGSTSSLSASNINHSAPGTPNLSASTNSSLSSRDAPISGTPLKETSFYKRALTEDIEPTLRLDVSPGLSWLARRSVINSMCEGKLMVEPIPPAARLYHPPCSLCGEQGHSIQHARTHSFRTSESESAQRYHLCNYCLARVRATCDFLGFLRMIKDGYWRTDGAQSEAVAWEESVRLRERMFWSRIGGGVIPAFIRVREDTPRSSTEDDKPTSHLVDPQTSFSRQDLQTEKSLHLVEGTKVEHVLPTLADTTSAFSSHLPQNTQSGQIEPPGLPLDGNDTAQLNGNRPSLSRTTTRPQGYSRTQGTNAGSVASRAAMFERRAMSEDEAPKQLRASLENSIKERSPVRPEAPEPSIGRSQHERGASSSIPGSFEF